MRFFGERNRKLVTVMKAVMKYGKDENTSENTMEWNLVWNFKPRLNLNSELETMNETKKLDGLLMEPCKEDVLLIRALIGDSVGICYRYSGFGNTIRWNLNYEHTFM